MCGIAGFSGSFEAELLGRMGTSLEHRGPDDSGSWLDERERVGLAHRRLSIIDTSPAGAQPMSNEDGKILLVYNGETYNFQPLREELLAKGHRFRSASDSEVLVHLYEEEGTEMLSRLNGIFAFAIWDGHRRELFLARDGVGVKPLYYATTPSGFLFGSEVKSLLLCDEVSRELDPAALHQFLAYLWVPAPRTALRGVRKLKPGEAMVVRAGRIERQWIYYDLPYGRPGPATGLTEDETVIRLREQLEAAVSRQMVSDVPVGAFLSGGLDSSAVVTMMRKARPDHRPRCYTIGFSQQTKDWNPLDLPYAERVAKQHDLDLRPIIVEPDMIRHLDRMLYHLDEPQADPAPINALLIAEHAHRDGYKVLLSGAGGDDIFSGYRRHWALRMERMWGWMPGAVRSGLAAAMLSRPAARALPRRVRKAFAHAGHDAEDRLITYFYWADEATRRGLYSDEFAAAVADLDTAEPLRASLANIPSEPDALNRMLYLEAKHFLADHNLNYTDKMGMAASVEVRVPLLDLELIDFVVGISPRLKQRGRVGKYIFKRAMEPYLPRDVIYRPKSGFGVPLRSWLRHDLNDIVREVLFSESFRSRGIFNEAAVSQLVHQDREGVIDGAHTVFALVCFELWARHFVDKSAAEHAATLY